MAGSKRKGILAAAFALALAVAGGCASQTGIGGGGVGVYADCFTDYCAEYDDTGLQRLYLRTPGTPVGSRSMVVTAAPRGETQVVVRDPGAPAPASARMAPIPSARPPGGRKP